MRDVAAVRRWFAGLALLEQLHGVDLDLFAEHATWATLQAGARLYGEGQPGSALWFLVEGEIVLGPSGGAGAVDGFVRLAVTTPGYPVGWDGMVWPGRHRWDAAAASRTRLLRVPREVIDDRCRADEAFARHACTSCSCGWRPRSCAGSTPA